MQPFQSIKKYQEELALDDNGCLDTVQYYLHRIHANKHLNAFVEVFSEECLKRASELDRKRVSGADIGLLHGVIISIKDVICYENHKVSAASAILKGFTSIYSATAVQRLLDEDAIIIGSCNCDEFAMGNTNENSVYGPVLNGLDQTKVPGGSSGGSAVAVQAGLCMLSLGSDTGGSVRQPADFCGIIGLKPTYGTISRYGLIAYASSFDQIGIFGTCIEDVSILLKIISGSDNFDSTASLQKFNIPPPKINKCGYRIAFLKSGLDHVALDPEIKSKIETLGSGLKEGKHLVKYIDFQLFDYVLPTYYVLTTAEASSNLARYDGVRYGNRSELNNNELTKFYTANRSAGFGDEVKRRIMLGTFVLSSGYYESYYSKAQQIRRLLVKESEQIFKEFDAIILPTVPSTAFALGKLNKDPVESYLADIYTVYANLIGIPAISIPLFKHSNGMPFGVQIMTNKYNELTLLEMADSVLSNYKEY